jgi:stage V sporulation protein G
MEITEVRIKLMEDSDDRLQAFCSITIDDCFVIRDLKIIEGASGPFVAMPSRKLTSNCPQCGAKNHLRSSYCNQCGVRLKEDRNLRDQDGRAKLYADIAHPINSQCREMIQKHVIDEYRAELQRATQPDYISHYDDDYDDSFDAPDVDVDEQPSEDESSQRPAPERTQIQPAEVEPRPPHRPPSKTPAEEPPRRKNDQFGAGIFE